jgi:hypothetical protein
MHEGAHGAGVHRREGEFAGPEFPAIRDVITRIGPAGFGPT